MRLRAEGRGPLVIKVAGLAGGVGLYHEAVASVRGAGFRVAELDTTGDRADDPAPCPLSWDFLAGEVIESIDRLEAPRAILWGTSFGTLVCLAAAVRKPLRVSALLLCSPPEPGWRPAPYVTLLRWAARRNRPDATAALVFQISFFALNGWEFLNPIALSRLPALARASRDARTPAATMHDKLRMLFEGHPGIPTPAPPTSIVTGAWDPLTPPSCAERLARRLPGSHLHLLRFAGHSCAYARPKAYALKLIAELRRLSSKSAAD